MSFRIAGSALTLVISFTVLVPRVDGPPVTDPSPVLGHHASAKPLRFEPNLGQWDGPAKFVADGPGRVFSLAPDGAELALRGGQRVRMRLAGADGSRRMRGLEELAGKTHYFMGDDPGRWRSGVSGYAKVTSDEIYPGVDLVFQGESGTLRYDFIVDPGADPNVIAMEFDGADSLRVDEAGDLVFQTAAGEVRQRRPTLYQDVRRVRRPVEGHYILRGPNRVGIEVGAYDRRETLVIDPTLIYSTYLGDVRHDAGNAIAVDETGAVYVAGGRQQGDNTDTDVFVAKFDPSGKTLLWRTHVRGHFSEEATGIALGPDGNVHITGWTGSFPSDPPGRPEYPRTPDALQPKYGGGTSDAFVTVLDPTGKMIYSTFLGGGGDDRGYDIEVNHRVRMYVAGTTSSTDFPTRDAAQPVLGGGKDGFVTVFDPTRQALVYSTYLGGTGDDVIVRAAPSFHHPFDLYNNRVRGARLPEGLVFAGTTSSPDFPTRDGVQMAYGGGSSDAFVACFGLAGRLKFATFLGGKGADEGRDVAMDAVGQIYLTGITNSEDFPLANPLEPGLSAPPNADAFLAKIMPSGRGLIYSTYLGAKGGDGVVVDDGENAYVTGGGVLAAQLDPSGSTLGYAFWALGGSAIAVDRDRNVYVTGETFSNLLPTLNAYQPRNGGMFSSRGREDSFAVKISDAPAPPPTFEENDARVSYTGTWVTDAAPGHSGGRAVFSEEKEATATISFTGTGIQVIGRREPISGYARVESENFWPWGSADTYASTAQYQSLILSITGLPASQHTIRLSVSGFHNTRSGGNRVWIDGFNILGAPAP
jgi:hypothetical protein